MCASVFIGLLFLWDWTVLGLYIYKVRKLRKVIKNKMEEDNVLRASYIVRKILFLTIFFEVFTLINVCLFSWSNHPSVSTAMHLFDSFISVIIIFLMQQHNGDCYRKCTGCCLSNVLLVERTKNLQRKCNT